MTVRTTNGERERERGITWSVSRQSDGAEKLEHCKLQPPTHHRKGKGSVMKCQPEIKHRLKPPPLMNLCFNSGQAKESRGEGSLVYSVYEGDEWGCTELAADTRL